MWKKGIGGGWGWSFCTDHHKYSLFSAVCIIFIAITLNHLALIPVVVDLNPAHVTCGMYSESVLYDLMSWKWHKSLIFVLFFFLTQHVKLVQPMKVKPSTSVPILNQLRAEVYHSNKNHKEDKNSQKLRPLSHPTTNFTPFTLCIFLNLLNIK